MFSPKKTAADRDNFSGSRNQEIGLTTDLVKFDMASVERRDGNIACRTWYDHTCDQIHFNAGAPDNALFGSRGQKRF